MGMSGELLMSSEVGIVGDYQINNKRPLSSEPITSCLESTHTIVFITYDDPIKITHRHHASLGLFKFWWWHHNQMCNSVDDVRVHLAIVKHAR